MSYAERLNKLVEYQNSIRTALSEKGATISSDSTLKDFPAAVSTITGDYGGPTPVEIMENGWEPYYSLVTNATRIASYAFVGAKTSEANFPYCSVVGECAFSNCTSLSYVNLPECKSIGSYAFFSTFYLRSLYAPKCEFVGMLAFSSCGLTEMNLPNLINGEQGFATYAKDLVSAYLPELTSCIETFSWCFNLSDVYIPRVSLLSGRAFCYCQTLSSLRLDNATKISCATYNPTFISCYNLRSLYLPSSTVCSLTASQAFSSTPMMGYWHSSICTMPSVYGSILVPYSLMDSYKTATNWAYYSSRIAGLVNISATNLSKSDTIVTAVDGKIFSTEMEVPSTSFTYSVYSKYPKYTGSQDDIDENSSINVALPTDGVKLTVNTTPEDAVVTITEDGIAKLTTKEITINGGETILVEVKKTGYRPHKSTLTVTDDNVIDIVLEETHIPENITPENASKYTTFVNGTNFEVVDGVIRSGSKSYHVGNGMSFGYIKLEVVDNCELIIEYSISSEQDYDYGFVMLSETYYSTLTRSDLLTNSNKLTIIAKCTGLKQNLTSSPIALSAGKTYYVYFVYTKDIGGNDNDDRFYIHSIKFEAAI